MSVKNWNDGMRDYGIHMQHLLTTIMAKTTDSGRLQHGTDKIT